VPIISSFSGLRIGLAGFSHSNKFRLGRTLKPVALPLIDRLVDIINQKNLLSCKLFNHEILGTYEKNDIKKRNKRVVQLNLFLYNNVREFGVVYFLQVAE